MQIFVTSRSPVLCAQALDDRRLVNQVHETAMILCTALRLNGVSAPMGASHVHHPVCKWAAESRANFDWTAALLKALHDEYRFRFGDAKRHASFVRMAMFFDNRWPDHASLKPGPFQNSARNATLDLDYTHLPVMSAYHCYLIARWERELAHGYQPKWTNRARPFWSPEGRRK